MTGGQEPYYPTDLNQEATYRNVKVKLLEIEGMRSTYQVSNILTGDSKNINRYHFKKWSDYEVVSVQTLSTLVEAVEKEREKNKPTWIHCGAGVGRTGTLVAACMLKSLINQKVINRHNLDASLSEIIYSLRAQRSPLLIETPEQFALVHNFAEFLLKIEDSDIKSSKK